MAAVATRFNLFISRPILACGQLCGSKDSLEILLAWSGSQEIEDIGWTIPWWTWLDGYFRCASFTRYMRVDSTGYGAPDEQQIESSIFRPTNGACRVFHIRCAIRKVEVRLLGASWWHQCTITNHSSCQEKLVSFILVCVWCRSLADWTWNPAGQKSAKLSTRRHEIFDHVKMTQYKLLISLFAAFIALLKKNRNCLSATSYQIS
jgi:hypothetical protein